MGNVFCKQPGGKYYLVVCVMGLCHLWFSLGALLWCFECSQRQYLSGYVSRFSKKVSLTKQRHATLVERAIVCRRVVGWNGHELWKYRTPMSLLGWEWTQQSIMKEQLGGLFTAQTWNMASPSRCKYGSYTILERPKFLRLEIGKGLAEDSEHS